MARIGHVVIREPPYACQMHGGVFICHASQDASLAQQFVTTLEAAGVGCWIAPRDIAPGESYTQAILEALAGAPALVLAFSTSTNLSPHVQRELEVAVGSGTQIIPVRLEDAEPSASLRYFIGTAQWLDIAGLDESTWGPVLVEAVRRMLNRASPGVSHDRPTAAALMPVRRQHPSMVRILSVVAVLAAVAAVAVGIALAKDGDGQTNDPAAGSSPTSSGSTPSSPDGSSSSATPSASTSVQSSPSLSPVTGQTVVEEQFQGPDTQFPLGTYPDNTGQIVASLVDGAYKTSTSGAGEGWDAWFSVDTPQGLTDWSVEVTATSVTPSGSCGVMAGDGTATVTASINGAGAKARISIYRHQKVLASEVFDFDPVTGPISISREGQALVMRVGDVVVGTLPPSQLGDLRQGGVVGVGDTNDCYFDNFSILTRS